MLKRMRYAKKRDSEHSNIMSSNKMTKESKIYVAGHRGLVGSAILRKLESEGFSNLITRTSQELDLIDQAIANDFFDKEKPEYVFLAAAKVGGIFANSEYPAEFIYSNLMIQSNVIHLAPLGSATRSLPLSSKSITSRMAFCVSLSFSNSRSSQAASTSVLISSVMIPCLVDQN